MKHSSFRTGLMPIIVLALAACGGGDDESFSDDDTGYAASAGTFDESELPADFPRDLIPPDYRAGGYVELGQVTGATFERSVPVQESIDHYKRLLGEPMLDVDSPDGERMVQWKDTPYLPWVVGVLGSDSESIVSVSKLPPE